MKIKTYHLELLNLKRKNIPQNYKALEEGILLRRWQPLSVDNRQKRNQNQKKKYYQEDQLGQNLQTNLKYSLLKNNLEYKHVIKRFSLTIYLWKLEQKRFKNFSSQIKHFLLMLYKFLSKNWLILRAILLENWPWPQLKKR